MIQVCDLRWGIKTKDERTDRLQAAKNMTEDFDLIEETFDSIHEAMKDIGLLEDRNAEQDHFMNRLMDIFLGLFDFCQFSAKMFKDYSRKSKLQSKLVYLINSDPLGRAVYHGAYEGKK